MATAVSGTGPTYVFLVMEALIDAAVHLGFPRHVAHDLVVETLEGSTHFAKQSGDHPAVLRNMVTSPGGHERRGASRARIGRLRTVLSEAVWAAYRRTVELGEQLEASVERDGQPRSPSSTGGPVPALTVDLRRAPLGDLRAHRLSGPIERDFFADGRAIFDRLCATWAGLDDAAWQPGRGVPLGRRRARLVVPGPRSPTWPAGPSSGVEIAAQGLAEAGRWPSDEEFAAATSTSSTRRSGTGGRA